MWNWIICSFSTLNSITTQVPFKFPNLLKHVKARRVLIGSELSKFGSIYGFGTLHCMFSTGFGVTGGSALIHEFYSREVANPVHLTVDTGFTNGEASIKAFVSINLSLGDQQLAAQFQEIPLDLRMVEAERIGFDILKTTAVDKLPTDMEGMEATMERLLALIDDTYKYVDDVVEGRVAPDNSIGRFISDSVASLPKISPSAFDKLVNDSLQDQLLLLYLSSITRTQLSLAEKLNTAAQIL
ncbi:putative eukaryotic translation initiation factor 3 subunit F [Helianthus annuus]|nr:putative eukaryotic translation initiation factor 3 subunit F [Helianthus annuus]